MTTENKQALERLNAVADRLASDLKTYKHIVLDGDVDRMTDDRFYDICNAVAVMVERLAQVKASCRRIINISLDAE